MLATQKIVAAAPAANFNSFPTQILETQQSFYESTQKFQETNQSVMEVDNAYRCSRESFSYGMSNATFKRERVGSDHTTALYENIALPDAFLSDYYSQVLVLFQLCIQLFLLFIYASY